MQSRTRFILSGIVIAILILGLGAINWVGFFLINSKQKNFHQRMREQMEQVQIAYQLQVDFKVQVQEWKNVVLRGHVAEDYER